MDKSPIGIIGAGAVGLAMATDCSLMGHEVWLSEVPGFAQRLPPDGEFVHRGLSFCEPHEKSMHRIRVREIIDFAEFKERQCGVVFVATCAMGHHLLPKITSAIGEDIPLIVICGNGSTIAQLTDRSISAETSTAPYGVRSVSDGIRVSILTPILGVSSRTEKGRSAALNALAPIFPKAFGFHHPLATLLSNPNPLMHPTIMLANLASIDRGEAFPFYRQGVTNAVRQLLLAKDAERRSVCRAIGSDCIAFDDFEGLIDMHGRVMVQHFLDCGSYVDLAAPASVRDRYLTEDVPFGLVVWEALGVANGIRTPIITAEIDQVSVILERNLRGEMRERTDAILAHRV